MDYDGFLKLAKARRTIREIKPDPIPDDYVDKLIEVARWAPSGFNMQPWEFIVVKDPEARKGVKAIVDDFRRHSYFQMEATREPWEGDRWAPENTDEFMMTEAPVYLFVCGDTRARSGLPMIGRFCRQKGDSIWESTLSNATIYMILAASALGLAAVYTSSVKVSTVQCLIKDFLGIPSSLEIHEILQLGYPAGKPGPKLMRKKEEMVHYDKAGEGEFRTDKEAYEQIKKHRLGNIGRHRAKTE